MHKENFVIGLVVVGVIAFFLGRLSVSDQKPQEDKGTEEKVADKGTKAQPPATATGQPGGQVGSTAQPQPVVQPRPVVQPQPVAQPQPVKVQPQPVRVQPQPVKVQPQPVKRQPIKRQPIKRQPVKVRPQPVKVQPQPVKVQPQPVRVQPQPVKRQPVKVAPVVVKGPAKIPGKDLRAGSVLAVEAPYKGPQVARAGQAPLL